MLATLIIFLFVSLQASGNIISLNENAQPYLTSLHIKLLINSLHQKCPELMMHEELYGKRQFGFYEEEIRANQLKIYNHLKALLKQCYEKLKSTRP